MSAPAGDATFLPADRLVAAFKALGDPVRLRLVRLIADAADAEACVCDLNEAFELSQPTISHHLKQLQNAGLVRREKRGVWAYYCLDGRVLDQLAAAVASPATLGRRDALVALDTSRQA